MEILRIELLNPKVRGVLEELAELKLINIQPGPSPSERFKDLLQKIRSVDPEGVSEDDIIRESEKVRSQRYGKKRR